MIKTLDNVKAEIKALVLENPNNVAQCSYTDSVATTNGMSAPTRPVCIVGCWANKVVGIPLESLVKYEGSSFKKMTVSDKPLFNITRTPIGNSACDITYDAYLFLHRLQDLQDCGYSWGEAWNILVSDDPIT